MKRNITQCDRCGGEITRGGRQIVVKAHHDTTKDLCATCFGVFEEFLEDPKKGSSRNSSVPKGYKRVARPCHHRVPCAEPWGCDGEEIVPLSDPRESLDSLGW